MVEKTWFGLSYTFSGESFSLGHCGSLSLGRSGYRFGSKSGQNM